MNASNFCTGNEQYPQLADIVLFGLSLSCFPSFERFPSNFKMRLLGKGFHTVISGGLFSTNVGHHISFSFRLSLFELSLSSFP